MYSLIDHVTGKPLGFRLIGTRLMGVKDSDGNISGNANQVKMTVSDNAKVLEVIDKSPKHEPPRQILHAHNLRPRKAKY